MSRTDVTANDDFKRRLETESDTIFNVVKNMTPQEFDDWVETNIDSLAKAKALLKMEGKAILIIIRKLKNAGLW